MVTHKLTPSPPERPRSNSVLTSYETTFQAPVLEERRRALNNWLLNRKADNRSEDEQNILEIFHVALRSRITGELSALQELATNKIAGSSKTTSSIASNVAATAIDILMSLITVIPVTGNVAIAVGGAITQQQSKNKAEASSEKLGDNDDLRRIIQDFSARVVAYYQHEITQLQVKAEAAGSPSITRVFSNYVLSKETTVLSESHRELIESIVEKFLQHLKTLDIKRIPLADMGAHLARPILLISHQQPVFSPELVIDDTTRINNAYHLIRLAQLAALPQSKKEEMAKLWNYTEPENLAEISSIEETSAVVLANPQHLLVSFARPNNKWLSIFENGGLIAHSSGIGRIHEGYYETFLKIWNEIKLNILSYLEQRRLRGQIPEIYFTGHELGGAFATFAAAELLLLQPDVKVHLYTFGQPRVGDLQFREFLKRNNVDYQRWIFSGDPMVNRVTKSGYVDMGMTLEMPTVTLKPHQQAFSLQQYHDGLFLYAQERDVTILIETEESEFEERSKEAAAEILALKRRVQEQNFRAHETEGLFVGHDEASVEHLGRLIAEPIAPPTIEITAPTPTRDALQLIQHIHSLLNNSGEEAYKELPLRSQELQELSFNIALIGTPYATTEALEQVLVHRRFEFLPADAKYALLLSYEHFLWLSFIRSKGHGYIPPPADLNGKLKQIWLDEKNNGGIYFQFMKISAILIILQEQKKVKDNGFAQLIIRLFAEIQISYAHPSESITVLEEIWSLLRKHPLIPPDYRDILFFTFLNQIQRPSVELIQWIQGKLLYYLENAANEWSSILSIAGLEFLIKQLQDAPNFVCEMIIVGDKKAIGLRHWLDNRLSTPPKEQEWPLEHYLQSKLTILSTHSEPLIQGLVTAHKLNSETELGRLGTLLTTLSQIASLTPEQKFRYLLLRHHLHNILGKKPNVNDYINLANAAENIHRNLAKRSYIRAQGLLQKTKAPALWKQMQQGLSRIYLAEANESIDKIPRIKMYTAALEADPENKAALEKLFAATLAPSLSAITLRLASIGRLIPADQKQSAIDNGEVIISGPFSGVYVLNPQALRQLFAGKELRAANVYDDRGVTRQEGQHVVAVAGEAPNQIHLKKNAGSTGLSLAAQAFYHVMFGLTDLIPPGLVPVEPLKIERKNQEPIYVQASPTVYGESLKQYLTKPAPALKDKDFDPLQLGALVIASLFLDPEDGRPPNWLVTLMDGVLHLMSVDNDHVWVRESIMKLKTIWGDSVNRPLVKNVLYCFPQMLEKFLTLYVIFY